MEAIPALKAYEQQLKNDPNTMKLFSSELSRLKVQSANKLEGEDLGKDKILFSLFLFVKRLMSKSFIIWLILYKKR